MNQAAHHTAPTIAHYISLHAERTPNAKAMVLGDKCITYQEFDAEVRRFAAALIAAGVSPGDRVATLQTPCPDYLITFIAASSIGAIWLGLNPRYRRAELEYLVRDAAPKVLLTRTQLGSRHYGEDINAIRSATPELSLVVCYDREIIPGAISLKQFLDAGRRIEHAILAERQDNSGGRQPCLLVYTSGSTGKPKGALLHQQGILDFSRTQNLLWPVSPYVSLNFLPINHIGCTVDLAIPCVLAGGTMVFMEQFDPAASLELIAKERVTFLGSVPSVFSLQVNDPGYSEADFSSVQLIVFEGAPISSELLDRLAAKCPILATNYGMTETTSAITATQPTADRDILLNSVGKAFPGVELRVVDDTGTPVGIGEVGEVQSRSANNFLGYWGKPEETAKAFTNDGFFKTGDLAEIRPDGRLKIVGRLKEMFKSGGYNVYPREVEAVFEDHPAVNESVIVSIPDPMWQEVGIAFVTLTAPITPDALLDWAKERLANYKLPKRLYIEKELPLLPIGKVDRSSLKERAIKLANH